MRYLSILISLCWCHHTMGQTCFEEKAEEYSIRHMYRDGNYIGGGVTFYDINKDGLDDLSFATGNSQALQVYLSTGTGFEDVGGLGINETRESKQILWIDYDNDGDSDLFVTNYEGPSRLWRNDGDLNLVDVTEEAGISGVHMPTFGAAWGDFDRDGFLDLFVPNYSNPAYDDNQQRNYLYRNQGDGTFVEVADRQNVLLHGQFNYYFSGAFLDLNRNGWPELFIIQDFGNNTGVTGNILFWNDQGQYRHADACGSLEDIKMDAMSIASGDFDKNGYLDVYITNTDFSHGRLHANLGDSTFEDQAELAGVTYNDDGWGWGAQFFDFDNDSWEDLGIVGATLALQEQPQIDKLYRNQRNGSFELLSPACVDFSDSTKSIGLAYGDYNADGRLDFAIATTKTDSSRFYENILNNGNHYLYCELEGTLSNTDGIGAWVELYAQDDHQVRYTTAGAGFLAQNTSKVHFGLESIDVVDSLIIKWPSGWTDRYYSIPADQVLDITEGETADFRFNLETTADELSSQDESIVISAPTFNQYQWNNDSKTQNITTQSSGVYVCSVIDEEGRRGLSNRLLILKKKEEVLSAPILHTAPPNLYPNPTSGVLHVSSNEPCLIKIYNSAGVLVLEGSEMRLDLSPYPRGIYYAVVQTAGNTIIEKVLKR